MKFMTTITIYWDCLHCQGPLGRKTNKFTLSGLSEEDLGMVLLVNKTACTNCLHLVANNHIPYIETPTIQPTHDQYLRYYTFNVH